MFLIDAADDFCFCERRVENLNEEDRRETKFSSTNWSDMLVEEILTGGPILCVKQLFLRSFRTKLVIIFLGFF